MEEDKGQNRVVIDWLSAHPGDAVFVEGPDGAITYGAAARAVAALARSEPAVIRPQPTPGGVVELLGAMSGAGAVLLGPATPAVPHPGGGVTLVHTSGSTGRPKWVRLTNDNWEAAGRASVLHLGHGPGDTWLLALPMHHVGGVSILVRSAFAGGRVRLLSGFDPHRFAEALRSGVTMASMVPTMLMRLLDVDPGPYAGLRGVLVGGGAIPEGLLERAVAAGLPVLPSYGMTETCGQVATLRPGSPVAARAHPLPGVGLRITGDGRIEVSGPMVFPGYLGEPDRSGDWFVTNDLGSLDSDGAVRVLGRADTVIVTGGENVAPERVELVVGSLPGAGSVVVVGLPSEEWGMEVACAYTGPAHPDALAEGARSALAPWMVPKRWLRVDSLPQTALGKPDRTAARELFSGSVGR